MGYETRLHVGIHYDFTPENAIGTIAVIELSVAGHRTHTGQLLADYRNRQHEEPTYAVWGEYATYIDEDGTDTHEPTYATTDLYGDKLTHVPLDRIITAMELDQAVDPYRRSAVALAVLRTIRDDPAWKHERRNGKIKVVQYGH